MVRLKVSDHPFETYLYAGNYANRTKSSFHKSFCSAAVDGDYCWLMSALRLKYTPIYRRGFLPPNTALGVKIR